MAGSDYCSLIKNSAWKKTTGTRKRGKVGHPDGKPTPYLAQMGPQAFDAVALVLALEAFVVVEDVLAELFAEGPRQGLT